MQKELLFEFLITGVSSFLLTAILCRIIIPILRNKKAGQIIRPEGPKWHATKAGTPTMGGICFIMAMLLALLGVTVYFALKGRQRELIPMALTMALAVLNGMIGFVDDYCKLLKKQNEGLKAHQKFLLQVLAAGIYIFLLKTLGYIDTALHVPFMGGTVELGVVYYVFAMFLIVGMVNSVNLTDGIDGLAASVTLVIAGFFGFVAFAFLHTSLALISGALIGGMIGFLIFNLHPAKVFMGDTGSLFLGGAVTGAAFIINEPMIIILAGGMYFVETLSVMLQVGSFKLRQKRIFKMAPIHHHLEQCGWCENKIVGVFCLLTAALCTLAWFGIGI